MSLQAACTFFWLTVLPISYANGEHTSRTIDQSSMLPEVTIPQGNLQGINLVSTKYNRNFAGFLGIPYAQPPIGKLRFSSPVAADGWSGTWDATADKNWCPQINADAGDEDCLYLNVYTPQLSKSNDSSLLPVMFYIPGGGFESSGGSSALYGPNHLLDVDIILVTINYRLGPLGFLSTGDEVVPGNWGLKDQVLALRWVQDNIAHFGGDANQVTIFGESAGAASVQLLALSDSTIGLFHKFISQSGAAYGGWVHRPRASCAKDALKLGEIFNCPTNTSALLVDCLREINASAIINTKSHFTNFQDRYPIVSWGPTDEPNIEGALLTDTPTNLIAAGKFHDLPSMTGVVQNEGILFVPSILPDSEEFEDYTEKFDDVLHSILQYTHHVKDIPKFTAAIKKFYFNNDLKSNRTQVWLNTVDLIGDTFFKYPVYNAVQQQFARAKNIPYFYTFDYRGTYSICNQYGLDNNLLQTLVSHGDDLIYQFTKLEGWLGRDIDGMNEEDLRMLDTMVQLWTSFAINGKPTTSTTISNTSWTPYSSEDNYLRIGNGSDASLYIEYNFLPEKMQFWKDLMATGSGTPVNVSSLRILIFVSLITYLEILY